MHKLCTTLILLLGTIGIFAQQKWTEASKGSFNLVQNQGGQALAYSPNSGVKILTVAGFAFKDLNKNGQLDPYEDWR